MMHLAKYLEKISLASLFLLLTGCAAQAPLMSSEVDIKTKSLTPPSDRALVYIYHRSYPFGILGGALMYGQLVNGRVIGLTSTGTYLSIYATPGKYTFQTVKLGREDANTLAKNLKVYPAYLSNKVEITLEAGRKYYFESDYQMGDKPPMLTAKSEAHGNSVIHNYRLSRYDPRNLTLDDFVKSSRGQSFKEERNSSNQGTANALTARPSDDNGSNWLGSVLEGLAAVFFIGLLVFGAAQGSNYAPAAYQHAVPPTHYQVSSGSTYSRKNDRIINSNNSEYWMVNGNTLRSSSGESFTVNGSSIYSSTGQTYQIIGNSVYGNDGSVCTVIGKIINCR